MKNLKEEARESSDLKILIVGESDRELEHGKIRESGEGRKKRKIGSWKNFGVCIEHLTWDDSVGRVGGSQEG